MRWLEKRAATRDPTGTLALISSFKRQVNEAAAGNAHAMTRMFEKSKDAWPTDSQDWLSVFSEFQTLHEILADAAKQFQPQLAEDRQGRLLQFSASTLFLRECWEYLTSDPSRFELLGGFRSEFHHRLCRTTHR